MPIEAQYHRTGVRVSSFSDVMQSNPPRLVVLYQRANDGTDHFQWGIVGSLPVLGLIASVCRAQYELLEEKYIPECEGETPALVITWDVVDKFSSFWLHTDVPTEPLLGMLEVIKATLVTGRLGQQAAAQRILGPDGQPWRK